MHFMCLFYAHVFCRRANVIKNWIIANKHSEVAYPWRTQGVEIGCKAEDSRCRKHERANRMPAVTCKLQPAGCRTG